MGAKVFNATEGYEDGSTDLVGYGDGPADGSADGNATEGYEDGPADGYGDGPADGSIDGAKRRAEWQKGGRSE